VRGFAGCATLGRLNINDAIKAGACLDSFIREQFKLAIELEDLDDQSKGGHIIPFANKALYFKAC
jgi:hypothetical protein